MSELNPHTEDEDLQAPNSLVEALNHLYKERVFVPPAVDDAMSREARKHLQRLQRPQSGWKPWLSWAAMAACLTLAIWLGERLTRPSGGKSFAREDINRDGRVDILDAFALARKIETGGILDPRWDMNGDGRIDPHFRAAGRDTGPEVFNPEWLFNVPGEIEGPVTGPDGRRIVSRALLNVRKAYGVDLPYVRDANHDGFPDVLGFRVEEPSGPRK